MDARLRTLAVEQADLVAVWQLRSAGWTPRMVEHHARAAGWRAIHRGVYALTQAPLTRRQLWIAATLTTPDTVLSGLSAGAYYGFRPWEGARETVTRPGDGGPRRIGNLLVSRSLMLDGDITRRDGIPMTTPERTLVDLARQLPVEPTARAFREALRLKTTTCARMLGCLERHQGGRGTRVLGELATRYGGIRFDRTRSNAEARALEVLHDAGIELPRVNMNIAGKTADLVWLDRRLIIEIDGPQYHRFSDQDRERDNLWERAGFTVRRIPAAPIYDEPWRLVALARRTSR